MANTVNTPFDYYGDPRRGRPLFNAKIFIGVADLDPTIPANQLQASYVQEDGTRVNLTQPIRTNSGGYPVNSSGDLITIEVQDANFSFIVQDRSNIEVINVSSSDSSEDIESRILTLQGQVPTSQEQLIGLGSSIFPLDIDTVAENHDGGNDDVGLVPAGTTHLRVSIGDNPEIVAISPVPSDDGAITLLTETGCSIGGAVTTFTQKNNFFTVSQVSLRRFIVGETLYVTDRVGARFVIEVGSSANTYTELPTGSSELIAKLNEPMPTLKMVGGVEGGESTAAWQSLLDYSHIVGVDTVTAANRFVISSDFTYRDGQKIVGLGGSTGIQPEETVSASFMQLINGAKGLTGQGARKQIHAEDLYFFGSSAVNGLGIVDSSGAQGVTGSGIPFFGQMGGRLDRCRFNGVEKAVENPSSFFMTYSDIDVRRCDFGLDIDDSNACVIEKFQASVTRRPIRGGSDSARLVLRDVSINVNDNCEIGIDVNGGIVFDGYTYLESFTNGSPATKQTGIRYASTQFSQRPVGISNVLLDNGQGGMSYGITLDAVNNTPTDIRGQIENVKFSGVFREKKIGYGIHNSSFPTLFLPINLDTCEGLARADVVGEQPSNRARIPITSVNLPFTDVSSGTYTPLVLNGDVTYDNVDAFSESNTRYRARRVGLYRVFANVLSDLATTQSRIEVRGVGLPAKTGLDISFSTILELSVGDVVEINSRNGGNVTGGNLNIEYISQGE